MLDLEESQFQKQNWKSDPTCGEKWNPNFKELAKSYGIHSQLISNRKDLKNKIQKFISLKGPSLLHCLVDESEEISPMLLAGQTLDKMWTDDR